MLLGLESAAHCVEDMDEWLGIFNVKLRHMREDIESVGASTFEVGYTICLPMIVVAVPNQVIVHLFSFSLSLVKGHACNNLVVTKLQLCQ